MFGNLWRAAGLILVGVILPGGSLIILASLIMQRTRWDRRVMSAPQKHGFSGREGTIITSRTVRR